MEPNRFRECLDADFSRMREVAARDLNVQVPSCPDWNVEALLRHTSAVYLHKVECMRNNAFPDPWPPDYIDTDEPLVLFDRAYADLIEQFDSRKPTDETVTWYEPEQTIGFWIRRMAQETVIHRVDAELALAKKVAPIPDDLAVDGIDEVLVRFLGYLTTKYRDEIADHLPASDLEPIVVGTPGGAWLITIGPGGINVEAITEDRKAGAFVYGEPMAMLLWLWRRAKDGVTLTGDPKLIETLQAGMEAATQ